MKSIISKNLIKLLKFFNYKLIKIQKDEISFKRIKYNIDFLKNDPTNHDLHFDLAMNAHKNGNLFLAFSEIKTAFFLKPDSKKIKKKLEEYKNRIPNLLALRFNQYLRCKILADEILCYKKSKQLKILDVGGGQGILASFIPEENYCLSEPTVNGISGQDLPFSDETFDYVVSCHVLEHIPKPERHIFLDSILAKSKKGVIILNPFNVDKGEIKNNRLKFLINITNANWAKEHLNLEMPTLEYIQDYANKNNLQLEIRANGNYLMTMTSFLMEHFAQKSGSFNDLKKINLFYNKNFTSHFEKMTLHPSDFIIKLFKK